MVTVWRGNSADKASILVIVHISFALSLPDLLADCSAMIWEREALEVLFNIDDHGDSMRQGPGPYSMTPIMANEQ